MIYKQKTDEFSIKILANLKKGKKINETKWYKIARSKWNKNGLWLQLAKQKLRWLQYKSFEWITYILFVTAWTLNMRTPNSKNSSKK